MINNNVKDIIRILNDNGYVAYVVGGAVRNMLLGISVYDYDIATNATPAQIQSLSFDISPSGIEHGSVIINYKNECFEVTTFRIETGYSDYRHPGQTTYSLSVKDDAVRRDFTINAIYYDPISDKILDFYNEKEDLENRILRTIGPAYQRFEEDALRIIRGLRFASTLSLRIEEETKRAIYGLYKNLGHISIERITDELSKLLLGDNVSKVMLEFIDVFNFIFGIDLSHENIKLLSKVKPTIEIRLAVLLRNVEEASLILKRLRFTNKVISEFEKYSLSLSKDISTFNDSFYIINMLGINNMDNYIKLLNDINYPKKKIDVINEYYSFVIENDIPLSINKLKINGDDLLSLGFIGKDIKNVLAVVHENVLFENLRNDKKVLIDFVMKKYL